MPACQKQKQMKCDFINLKVATARSIRRQCHFLLVENDYWTGSPVKVLKIVKALL